MNTPNTKAGRLTEEITKQIEECVAAMRINSRTYQAQRAALAEARKPIETCQNCHQLGVQLDLIRDELRRIEARILESEFSEDPRLSNILEYCRRSQRDIPTFYSVIGERDRLEAENLKLRITVEDQSAAIEAMNKESEDRNQKWAEKSIYASQLEQQIANIKSQATTQRAALEKVRERLDNAQRSMPAYHEGGFHFERHDMDGNYIGSENVDPISVVQGLEKAVSEALTAIDSVLVK